MQSGPKASSKVEALLRTHPWYESRWRYEVTKTPESQHGEILFMQAARWADNIRTEARLQREARWHYINWPFKPDGEPEHIRTLPPQSDNILAGLAENERILRSNADQQKRAFALAWIFHLIGDIHQPLHTVQMFTREYPNGDRGGNEICIRTVSGQPAVNLHQLWDGLITSSSNVNRLNQVATELLAKFSKVGLRELDTDQPEGWAKESYDIATRIAYEGGELRGTLAGKPVTAGMYKPSCLYHEAIRHGQDLSPTADCIWRASD